MTRPGPKALETPTEVPDDKPDEVDADANSLGGSGADPYADAKRYGDGSTGRVSSAPKAAPPPPPAPPPPKPVRREVQRLTRDMTPPSPLAQSAPSYPSDAKDSGVEGTVIVRYVIQQDGSVSNVRAVRGPAELRAVCVAAVQRWRFKPAMLDGRAVAVSRTASFPFRIKT
jgi:protein TonB